MGQVLELLGLLAQRPVLRPQLVHHGVLEEVFHNNLHHGKLKTRQQVI